VGLDDAKSFQLQIHADEARHARLVVDDENQLSIL
jgi:hypothetical protein